MRLGVWALVVGLSTFVVGQPTKWPWAVAGAGVSGSWKMPFMD